jgi:hypothetical protein
VLTQISGILVSAPEANNYTVWDSGITEIEGDVRNGGTIRIRTTNANRRYRLPLGLFKSVRTFTLSSQDAMTHLRVTEEFTGPLAGLMGNTVEDTVDSFADHVRAVKERAELFG